ncbi:hypothetical protein [Acaryochloris sp. IP29b_bin.148]|uniref:hypothetical protein n=1 Tax=Acaryochloris sp. IP29b_bin.148 TaxID=2969218 RepID=UPI002638F610|nr:hypothetical protein [Acaryochloris sp. IP29b_bin.148]
MPCYINYIRTEDISSPSRYRTSQLNPPGRGKNTTLRSVEPGNRPFAVAGKQPANGAVPQRERAENAEWVCPMFLVATPGEIHG